MTDWNTIAALSCLALAIFLVWKEWSRPNRAFRVARTVAAIMAAGSLYLLAVPPSYKRSVPFQPGLVLLTDGYAKGQEKSQQAIEGLPVYDLREAHNAPSFEQMLGGYGGPVHVFGYGLKAEQLRKLKARQVIFHPSPLPPGISQVKYQRELAQGEQLHVRGFFLRRDSAEVRVTLSQFGKLLDSCRTRNGVFEVNTLPAHIGPGTYSLVALSQGDTLEKQVLPVVVAAQKPLQVLLLGAAPGFESRVLKDWMARKGYQLTSRTMISKDRYSTAFINRERNGVERINEQVLGDKDLVVADQAALASLTTMERVALQQAIRSKGLGLLYWPDEGSGMFGLHVSKFPGGEQQKLDIVLDDTTVFRLNTEQQQAIEWASTMLPLVRTKDGKILAAARQEGRGRIVANTLGYSYKWSLQGQQSAYDRYWTLLINKTLGPEQREIWRVPDFAFVNEPAEIQVETDFGNPTGMVDSQRVYLAADPLLPFLWQGRFWPRRTGWQQLSRLDGRPQWFYVFPKDAWALMMANRRLLENKAFVAFSVSENGSGVRQTREESRRVPFIVYVLLFMVSAGFLWYENKRMGG